MSIVPTVAAQTLVKALNTFTPFSIDRPALGTVVPLTETPRLFYLRRDTTTPRTKINVYSTDGTTPFTFERQHRLSTTWRMSHSDTGEPIAAITVSVTGASVDFFAKPGLKHRKLKSKYALLPAGYSFQLNDGAQYVWDSTTRYLERVINNGGGVEETRQRLGRATLLRRFSFDWEVQVDPRLDPEVALATVLAPLLTEWPTTVLDHAAGVRTVLPAAKAPLANEFVDGIDPSLLVYTEGKNLGVPQDFFNPPAFLQNTRIEG